MKIAYSYGRFSTLAQGDDGKDSQRRQVSVTRDWCKQNGYTLSDQTFFDKGKSGFKGEHISEGGDLLRFIKLVEDGSIPKASVLVIDSYDRFARLPPSKSLALFMRVIDAGIKLVFAGSYEKRLIDSESIDKEPNLLQFIIGEMIRSYNESKEKSRKIIEAKRAKTARMQAGEIVAHNNIPKYFTFDRAKRQYVHNANTEIVRELVDGILAGKSLYGMANDLNGRKVKTFRRGFEWAGTSIRSILRNRTLIGEYLGNKGFVPRIIDQDTFNRVQNILSRNTYLRGKRATIPNMFRGICFCADCGKSMSIASQVCKGVLYRYLKCSVGGLGRNHSCSNKKLIRLDEMETDFFTHFFNKHPYELINGDDKTELKEIRTTIEAKQVQLNKLNADVKAGVALFGIIKADEFKDKMLKLEGERTKVKSELDSLNLKLSMVQDAPKNLREVLLTITDFDANADGSDRVRVVYADTHENIEAALKDNAIREQIRLLLPSLIGKITVDATKGQFYVYNRVGKLIFESHPQKSNRNRSERWKKALGQWTTRTVKGRTITVKRRAKRLVA